jgi:hypothetical protein
MLKPEERLWQKWEFGGWNGTPRQLADTVKAIYGLIPDGDFRARVSKSKQPAQVTDEPEGLAQMPLEHDFKSVEVEITKIPENSDFYRIDLRFGSGVVFENQVRCHAPTELESRTMLQAARDVVQPNVPWHSKLRTPLLSGAASLALTVLVFGGIGFALHAALPPTLTTTAAAGLRIASFVVGGVALFLAYWALEWLFPRFELYSERPRRRRFSWALFTLIALPLLIALVPLLIK